MWKANIEKGSLALPNKIHHWDWITHFSIQKNEQMWAKLWSSHCVYVLCSLYLLSVVCLIHRIHLYFTNALNIFCWTSNSMHTKKDNEKRVSKIVCVDVRLSYYYWGLMCIQYIQSIANELLMSNIYIGSACYSTLEIHFSFLLCQTVQQSSVFRLLVSLLISPKLMFVHILVVNLFWREQTDG